MALLKKTSTGDWVNHEGFIGAIMLNWQPPDDADGRKHYRFLATPYDTHAHDIVHNGEDDAVLISKDMLSALIARRVARRMTDAEADAANRNAQDEDVMGVHQENIAGQNEVTDRNGLEREKKSTAADASKPAPRVNLPNPPPPQTVDGVKATESQIAAARATAGKGKEGK